MTSPNPYAQPPSCTFMQPQPIATAPAPSAFPMPDLKMPDSKMPQFNMPTVPPDALYEHRIIAAGVKWCEENNVLRIMNRDCYIAIVIVNREEDKHSFCIEVETGWSPPSTTCPPGLEYLTALDHLFVKQQVELLEVISGFETKNKYKVMNVRGEQVFYVAEESSFCARCCLGPSRSCEFKVFDGNGRLVLHMTRPFRCDSCCCPCCLQELEVYAGNVLLGSVTQDWSLWQPSFSVRDASGETVLTIKGPWIKFCVNVTFKVKSADGQYQVGMIKKKWSGIERELLTYADNYGVSFPLDLDVKIKAVLLGACLLIDFMYFEGGNNKSSLGSGIGDIGNILPSVL